MRSSYVTELRFALAALAAALGPGVAAGAAADDEAARGRDLAMRLCARCHLNPGQGEKNGPDGVPGFRAVSKRPHQTFEGVVQWLESKPPMMPDHHLTRDEIFRLAAFIMSLADEKE